MGISTPKPPFDLAAFLSQKASPGSRRKPAWNRPRSAAPAEVDTAEDSAEDSQSAIKDVK